MLKTRIDDFLLWLNEWSLTQCRDRKLIADNAELLQAGRDWIAEAVHDLQGLEDPNEVCDEEVIDFFDSRFPGGWQGFIKHHFEGE
jgi:hypothetical protein